MSTLTPAAPKNSVPGPTAPSTGSRRGLTRMHADSKSYSVRMSNGLIREDLR